MCTCLQDSLIRDCLVIGINNSNIQKKLLQNHKLTSTRALRPSHYICPNSETRKNKGKRFTPTTDNRTYIINCISATNAVDTRRSLDYVISTRIFKSYKSLVYWPRRISAVEIHSTLFIHVYRSII